MKHLGAFRATHRPPLVVEAEGSDLVDMASSQNLHIAAKEIFLTLDSRHNRQAGREVLIFVSAEDEGPFLYVHVSRIPNSSVIHWSI